MMRLKVLCILAGVVFVVAQPPLMGGQAALASDRDVTIINPPTSPVPVTGAVNATIPDKMTVNSLPANPVPVLAHSSSNAGEFGVVDAHGGLDARVDRVQVLAQSSSNAGEFGVVDAHGGLNAHVNPVQILAHSSSRSFH